MFINEMSDSGQPLCAVCEQPLVADQGATSNGYITPEGIALIHNICASNVNKLARFITGRS